MTFSYTDDAIVSTSPTGRHLSTVIKRPVVLMSGWNEHAEAVCKVLNESTAASRIGGTIGTLSYRVEVDCSQALRELDKLASEPSLADLVTEGYLKPMPVDYLGLNWPKAYDFSALEARATAEQVRKCESRETYTVRLTIGGREAFKTVPAEEAAPLLMKALEDRDAKLAAVTAELEELQSKPVEVSGQLLDFITSLNPGTRIYVGGRIIIKRV